MLRNRFQILLRIWHFSDNMQCLHDDHLHRIKRLLEKLIKNFRSFCIDESIFPFHGRLLMKQYIHKKKPTSMGLTYLNYVVIMDIHIDLDLTRLTLNGE